MLIRLSAHASARQVGAKAARLGWLMGRGWTVPPGVVVPFQVTDRLIGRDGSAAIAELRESLAASLLPGVHYAVRSSADVEDHGARSFAGQFVTVLDVAGVDAVLDAVQQVLSSVRADRVRAYARHVGVDPDALRMAVIVQRMVAPVASGVAFSRDPVTGADRVVMEAVAGRGDRLVGQGVTPQRWILGRRGTLAEPAEPLVPRETAAQIAEMVRAVAAECGEPVDVEWVWDGTALHLVQCRPITGLAEGARIWSSRMAKDMLPGLIPPLVWSVNVPVLSRVWSDLVEEALGPPRLDPDDLVRPFGYRAYFNMGAFGRIFLSLGLPPDALEELREGGGSSPMRPAMSALLPRAPRLTRLGFRLLTWDSRVTPAAAAVERDRHRESSERLDLLPDAALLARVDRLRTLVGRAGRLNIITPLLADALATVMRRAAERRGIDPGTVDPGQDLPGVRGLDPAHALATLRPDDPGAWTAFLHRFGHLSDSPNDCSRPTWAEEPEAVRRVLEGPGRQLSDQPAEDTRARLLARTVVWQRPLLAWGWSKAAALRLARERVGYTYARVYALLRPALLEAGGRLAAREVLRDRDDVFLLTLEEVRLALSGDLRHASDLVTRRRSEMAEAATLSWPETIIGDDPLPVRGRSGASVLHGVPTSRGRRTGPARVVTSLAAAPHIGPDDVLVLEAADVTWTPLLLRAGAVVTETGGMLSHASIVARELGIPCVASVTGVTEITEGVAISVDGGTGEVLLLAQEGERP